MTASKRLGDLLDHPALAGLAVGACAAGDIWLGDTEARYHERAHAHIAGNRKGWVCVRKLKHYNPTTLRHEIAHLVRENTRHDEAWRAEVRALGGRVERAYQKH